MILSFSIDMSRQKSILEKIYKYKCDWSYIEIIWTCEVLESSEKLNKDEST